MRSQRPFTQSGMSLVEATIILGVLAVLSAIAAPAIDGFLADARATRVREDEKVIASAMGRFFADTGESWFLISGNNGGTPPDLVAPLHGSANLVKMLVGDGDIPAKSVVRTGSATPDWDSVRDEGGTNLVQSLAEHLMRNAPSNDAARNYRTAANMTSTTSRTFDPATGATYNAPFAWRGPYLASPIDPDPWGHRYAVNVEFLAHLSGSAAPGGNSNDVFIISAGPDGETDTRYDVDGVVPGDDDVIMVVQGGSR
jgi:type II secretory pathway pseudopilin PulG